MNGTGQPRSWRERALPVDTDVDIERDPTDTRGGEINVMWASSQGGCGPLKQLLRNVEETVHPPPRQLRPPLFFELSSSSGSRDASPLQGLSQSSTSSSSSRSSCTFSSMMSGQSTSSSRAPRRARLTLSRVNDASSKGVSLLSVRRTKSGGISGASQISSVLSRVSRSLNEKAMIEYDLSQRRRSQQSEAVDCLSPPLTRSQTETARPISPKDGTKVFSSDSLCPTSSGTFSASLKPEIVAPSSSIVRGLNRRTSIADSPRQVRMKALLETIDQAKRFPSTSPSSTPFVLHTDSKPASYTTSSLQSKGKHNTSSHGPSRKSPALCMRRPVPRSPFPHSQVQSRSTSIGLFESPSSQRTSKKSLVRGANSSESMTYDITSVARTRNLSRGYRTSPPLSQQSITPSFSSDADMEMCADATFRPSKAPVSIVNDTLLQDEVPELERDIAGEENETNISDGASSGNSSYGDIDIDVAVLEEACRAYDT